MGKIVHLIHFVETRKQGHYNQFLGCRETGEPRRSWYETYMTASD